MSVFRDSRKRYRLLFALLALVALTLSPVAGLDGADPSMGGTYGNDGDVDDGIFCYKCLLKSYPTYSSIECAESPPGVTGQLQCSLTVSFTRKVVCKEEGGACVNVVIWG